MSEQEIQSLEDLGGALGQGDAPACLLSAPDAARERP